MGIITFLFVFWTVGAINGLRMRNTPRVIMKHGGVGGTESGPHQPKSLACIFRPKTDNQKKYYDYLKNDNVNIVVCSGPAGSGKTALACHYAIDKLKQGVFKKIIITRPLVTVEEDIGFLPGTLNKKMEPWTRPMMDIFNEYYPMSVLDNMCKEGIIEISPLAFMRGRTFKNAIIIADEMQNSSPNQMLMVTTRIGESSKLVITGDLKQTDTHDSGLKDLLYRYRAHSHSVQNITDHVKLVEMGNEDIVRHHVVSKILDLYNAGAASPPPAAPVPSPISKSTLGNVIKSMLDSQGFVEVSEIQGAMAASRENGTTVSSAAIPSPSPTPQNDSYMISIPDFSGGGSAPASSVDAALIPAKDANVLSKYIRCGITDGIFDDACFLESMNVNYTNNSTEIRKK